MIAPAAKRPTLPEVAAIKSEPAWLSSVRKTALSRFSKMGLPTVKDEDWRFTNVAPLADFSFRPASHPGSGDIEDEAVRQFTSAQPGGNRLVFVNGHFAPALSSVAALEQGVKIMGLAEALVREPEQVKRHLFHVSPPNPTVFASLNEALFEDGAFIHVPAGRTVAEPARLLYIFTPNDSGEAVYPRNLIIVERGSHLTVTESYVGEAGAKYFTGCVTELVVGDEAHVEYLKLQDESRGSFHLATLAASLGRACEVRIHSMAFGARLSRTNIHAVLAGEGVECLLNGLYLVRGEQLADHHMIVDHAVPRGASHEYFNGILSEKAKGVFHGRIIVRPDAQKTDAKQTNKNLLLSDDATVDTKPQLEIYADDVKCTHGATVGQLSDEAVFYLRSRGIPLEKARHMLIYAFAGEIIDRIRCEALRRELNEAVWKHLEEISSSPEPP